MPRPRERVTSPRFAVTLKFAIVLKSSCSMYDPSEEAKYFHSVLKFADAVAAMTSLRLIASSTTAWSAARFSVSGIVIGSCVISVRQ